MLFRSSRLHVSTRSQRVRTPAGLFDCLRVRWDNGQDGITDEWFADGIGLVQRRMWRNGRRVDLELVRAVVSGNVVVGAPAQEVPMSLRHLVDGERFVRW